MKSRPIPPSHIGETHSQSHLLYQLNRMYGWDAKEIEDPSYSVQQLRNQIAKDGFDLPIEEREYLETLIDGLTDDESLTKEQFDRILLLRQYGPTEENIERFKGLTQEKEL